MIIEISKYFICFIIVSLGFVSISLFIGWVTEQIETNNYASWVDYIVVIIICGVLGFIAYQAYLEIF